MGSDGPLVLDYTAGWSNININMTNTLHKVHYPRFQETISHSRELKKKSDKREGITWGATLSILA